jgi:hypothetical protein
MGEAWGKVSGWGPHRGDVSSTGWRRAVDVAAFYDSDGSAAAVDDVLEVLQLQKGHGEMRRKEDSKEEHGGLTLTERQGGGYAAD